MVGRYSSLSLAASAFAGSVFALFIVFGMASSTFVSTLVSQAYGAGHHFKCGEILRHAIIINLLMGLSMGFIIQLGIPFLVFFGQDPRVLEEAAPYLIVVGWSSLPIFLFQALRQYSEALTQTIPPMLITAAGILLNALFNWIFIFGKFGFPELGLLGAAYSTLLCRILMFVGLAWLIARDPYFKDFFPKSWLAKFQPSIFKTAIKIGFPSGFQGLFEMGTFAMAAVMMGWIGVNELAAHQIALSMAATTFMVALGISFAATILVGMAFGRGQMSEARRAGIRALFLGIITMGLFGIFFAIGHHYLPRIYTEDPQILQIAGDFMVVAAIFQIFDGVQVISLGCLRGISDIRMPTLITLFNYSFWALPLCYYLGFHTSLGAIGIWIGLALGLLTASLALSFRFLQLVKYQ